MQHFWMQAAIKPERRSTSCWSVCVSTVWFPCCQPSCTFVYLPSCSFLLFCSLVLSQYSLVLALFCHFPPCALCYNKPQSHLSECLRVDPHLSFPTWLTLFAVTASQLWSEIETQTVLSFQDIFEACCLMWTPHFYLIVTILPNMSYSGVGCNKKHSVFNINTQGLCYSSRALNRCHL